MLPHRTTHTRAAASPARAVFALNGGRFAVPARHVLEVVKIDGYAPLPCENPAHLGLVLHRESVIPLVDLGALLAMPRPGPIRFPALCLVLRGDSGAIACPVDQVLGLAHAADGAYAQHIALAGGIAVLRADTREERYGQAAAR